MANPNSRKLTTSNGIQYYGIGLKNAQKALSTGYLEKSISISMHSQLPENMQTPSSKYDYKSGLCVYLKPSAAKTLAKLGRRFANALAEGNETDDVAVTTGTNVIGICDGTKFGLSVGFTLYICSDIQSNKTTDTYDVFQFTNTKYLRNYDRSAGTYDEGTISADVDCFLDQLNDFSRNCSNAAAHIVKAEFAYDLNRQRSNMLQVMDKLGIQPTDYKFSAGSSWVNKDVKPASSQSVETMSTDDLMSELDNM